MWKHLLQHRIALVGLKIPLPFKGKYLIIIAKNYLVRNQNCVIKQWISVGWCKLYWQSQEQNYHYQANTVHKAYQEKDA